MRRISKLGAAIGALAVALMALLTTILTSASAAPVIVTIVYDSGSFHPASAQAPYHSFVRFTNNSGLQLHVFSTSKTNVCSFDITLPAFSTSPTKGPFAHGGRCDYRGDTILGSSAATIQVQGPPPGPTPTPTPTPTATKPPTPSRSPSTSPSTSPNPSSSASASPSLTPSASPEASAAPSLSPSPTGAVQPAPSASPSAGPAVLLDLRDQGRRNVGLPGALAALAVAALFGALARVLSAEAAR